MLNSLVWNEVIITSSSSNSIIIATQKPKNIIAKSVYVMMQSLQHHLTHDDRDSKATMIKKSNMSVLDKVIIS